jgi:hypothetical protein
MLAQDRMQAIFVFPSTMPSETFSGKLPGVKLLYERMTEYLEVIEKQVSDL